MDSVFDGNRLLYVKSSLHKATDLLLTYQNYSTVFCFHQNGFTNVNIEEKYCSLYIDNCKLKYGWWVQDDCHTSNTSDLKNNDWNHHYYGMVFLPLGVDGTLGNQIGDGNDDYNFDFAGTYDNTPDNYRLFRIVNGINPQPYFYTNNFLTTCGSNPTGNEFILTPTGALIDPCNSTYSFTPSPIGGENNTEEEENALQLLHESVTFYANPAVAEWLAQMKLYNALDVDSITRLGNLTLHTFYDNLRYQNIGYINDANRKIVALVSQDNLAVG
ncbi:MAG: hypothetical protein ORN55_03790 [Chitinophagaceae bacterium]|nr:hypothetical protein [Chitinophagaceae bacterium]